MSSPSSPSTPLFFFLLLLSVSSLALSHTVIQLPTTVDISGDRKVRAGNDNLYCESWRFTVETNNAGIWATIPSRCARFVRDYVTGEGYLSDSEAVGNCSAEFAKSVQIAGDGKDAWVFDIDETLLSNVPYYQLHGFGADVFDEKSFDEWVDLANAPALPASFSLYRQLQQLGFKIFLLTGRSEYQRNATEKNLRSANYSNWERLILRKPSDRGKPATIYKSEKRLELVKEGYRIHGNSGDQWSDLLGFAVANRSFKLPNPMYYIS